MEFLFNDCTADKWCLITEIVNVLYKMQIRKSDFLLKWCTPPPPKKKPLYWTFTFIISVNTYHI